jgi:hypothetical protein
METFSKDLQPPFPSGRCFRYLAKRSRHSRRETDVDSSYIMECSRSWCVSATQNPVEEVIEQYKMNLKHASYRFSVDSYRRAIPKPSLLRRPR